jgi:hypothetical protein
MPRQLIVRSWGFAASAGEEMDRRRLVRVSLAFGEERLGSLHDDSFSAAAAAKIW